MKKLFFFIFLHFIFGFCANAQSINLEFPYFAGKTYEFKIVQGEKQIVLVRDTIPQNGKVELTIPQNYQGYKGMAMWYITNSEKGGGLEMIINNENFSVSCLDSIPNATSIVFKNTKENVFANSNYDLQKSILKKYDAMRFAINAYEKTNDLYPIFATEYEVIAKVYADFIKKLNDNPLYAARFREISNITMGIGSVLTQDEKLKAQDINNIIVNEMDFAALYTSNHWGGIINNWVQLQTIVLKNDTQTISDAKKILKRIVSDLIYTEFVVSLTKELSKKGKDNIVDALTKEIKSSNRLLNYQGVLSIYKNDLIGKAPNLIFPYNKNYNIKNGSKIVDFATQKHKYSLLVFYKSGCGPCEDLMTELQKNHKDLTSKGIEIITVSADTSQDEFSNSSLQQPWMQKYCDLQGTAGINFKNYAIIGTPTLYLIDNKGNIIKKMSSILNLKEWIKNAAK